MLRIFSLLFILFSFCPFESKSSASMSGFNDFISYSDFIIYGEVREVIFFDDGSGQAKIKVESVFKGVLKDKSIIFKWGKGYTEQKITKALERYLFFLKLDGSAYVASIHGASAWEVVYFFEDPEGSVIRPMPVKDLPSEVYTKADELNCSTYRDCTRARITIRTFKNYIESLKAQNRTATF